MSNDEKYISVFADAFQLPIDQVSGLVYQGIPAWDSVGHMALMAQMEESFNILLDTDDIIDFSSFEVGKKILEKYKVVFSHVA